MNRKLYFSLILALMLMQGASAQNIINSELNATPLAVNPAFTGMFNGDVRANAIYSNLWTNTIVNPYTTYGASADVRIFTNGNRNYVALGLQHTNDQLGMRNPSNSNSLLSLSYHKLFRKIYDSNNNHISDLAIGLQAGYNQSRIDLSQIYFGHNDGEPAFIPGTGGPYYFGINYPVNYYSANGGICYSHKAGPHFNYTIGLAGYNLNLSYHNSWNTQYWNYGNDRHYIGEIGADWMVTSRLTLRPEILYQSQSDASGVIAGNEFRYNVSKNAERHNATSLFAGIWYHTGNSMIISSGIQFRCLQISMSYDFNYARGYNYEDGYIETIASSGTAISLKYIFQNQKSNYHNRTIPDTRF